MNGQFPRSLDEKMADKSPGDIKVETGSTVVAAQGHILREKKVMKVETESKCLIL
jgi:hypothetical protein